MIGGGALRRQAASRKLPATDEEPLSRAWKAEPIWTAPARTRRRRAGIAATGWFETPASVGEEADWTARTEYSFMNPEAAEG